MGKCKRWGGGLNIRQTTDIICERSLCDYCDQKYSKSQNGGWGEGGV